MMEERVNMNFCVKLQKSPSETLEILKIIYGESPGQTINGSHTPRSKEFWICFVDIRGMIHFEFVPERTIVNQTFLLEMLERFIDAVRRKRGE
jgi:hypothetical protein